MPAMAVELRPQVNICILTAPVECGEVLALQMWLSTFHWSDVISRSENYSCQGQSQPPARCTLGSQAQWSGQVLADGCQRG